MRTWFVSCRTNSAVLLLMGDGGHLFDSLKTHKRQQSLEYFDCQRHHKNSLGKGEVESSILSRSTIQLP